MSEQPPSSHACDELVKLDTGVFAFVQHDGGWCVNNAGVLLGPESVTLIDTAATEARSRRLRATVDSVTDAPCTMVVNTHHHGDHTFGNAITAPGAVVVAHEAARTRMAADGLALTRLWPGVTWGSITVELPTLTFRSTLTMYVGDLQVELLHLGPAHTAGDVVVWLPEPRVLFTGDIAFSGGTPFVLMGSVVGTVVALQTLRDLGPRTVVSGHGPVTGPELLDESIAYHEWLQRVARDAHDAGMTPLQAARRHRVGPFAHLTHPERLVANMHRAYAEIGGPARERLVDYDQAFADMVELNGGLPACRA
jgi:cyclase